MFINKKIFVVCMQKRGHTHGHTHKRISDTEHELIHIKLEKLKIERERAVLILNFGIVIYFIFLILALVGYVNSYVSTFFLNLIILGGILILVVAVFPYTKVMKNEEEEINAIL